MFCAEYSNGLSRAIFTSIYMELIRKCYEEVRKELVGTWDRGYLSIEISDWKAGSFQGFASFCSNKKSTRLSTMTLVAHPIHFIFLNTSARKTNGS